jgi:CBS domain containing-hemolysin-like protein
MYSQFLLLAVLIVFSSIFSGSETALVSINNSKVDELVAQKVKNSKYLKKLKKDPHRLLITVLIGNNVVNIAASAYAAVLFTELLGSSGVGIATGVMTFFILIFGEITPKSFAHQHSVGVSLFMAKPIYFFQIFLFPAVWLFDKIVNSVNKVFGTKKAFTVTEGEIVAMLKIGAQEGSIEKHEREFIENILEFNDIEVEEVMTPRVNIDAIDVEMTIQEAVDFAIKHSHSRLPVYQNDIDNIIGVISIKELLRFYDELNANKKLKNLDLSTPMQVPLSKKINKLFRDFQRNHVHIAIVIDEYGGTAGIVTIEDLLEEIVGEIVDETDPHEKLIEVVNKNTIIVSGSTIVEDVNDFFRIKFADNEHDLVNTVLVDHLHRFPREGEVIDFPRVKVHILQMEDNLVTKVDIKRKRRRQDT